MKIMFKEKVVRVSVGKKEGAVTRLYTSSYGLFTHFLHSIAINYYNQKALSLKLASIEI